MSRDDIQKLLGGYATGTLTSEEQQALFEAALTDQELFDALAREEALREVLSDSASRACLLAALDEAPAPWYRVWWRPMVVIATALSLVVSLALWERSHTAQPPQVAKVDLPRFRPPADEQKAPELPPEPRLKRDEAPITPLNLPGAAPVAPPAPPTVAAAPPPVLRALPTPPPAAGVPTTPVPAPQPQMAQQSAMGRLQGPMQQSQQSPQVRDGNGILDRSTVPLHVVVTDASGAAVPSASVAVKSVATGEVENSMTDSRGEVSATAAPGGAYQITVSAPGFQTATVTRTVAPYPTPEPVSLKLEVGPASAAVEVESSAAIAPVRAKTGAMGGAAGFGGGGGRGGRGGAPNGARTAAPTMAKAAKGPAAQPLVYHLLRQIPDSDPEEVAADGTVPVGSTLLLRVTPARDGTLRIVGGDTTLASPVESGKQFETVLPVFRKRGRVQLKLYLSTGETESKEDAPTEIISVNVR